MKSCCPHREVNMKLAPGSDLQTKRQQGARASCHRVFKALDLRQPPGLVCAKFHSQNALPFRPAGMVLQYIVRMAIRCNSWHYLQAVRRSVIHNFFELSDIFFRPPGLTQESP